jgi:hypothetical protein
MGGLVDAIRAYHLRAPFYIEVEIDNGRKYWRVRVREEVPLEFSAILGDSIHNLRAALDLLACELVRLNHQNDDDVYFPFANSAADFPPMLARRHMDRSSPQVQALLHSLKPYRGGDDELRAIHDLDIVDKHQMLIPAADTIGMPDYAGSTGLVTGLRIGPIRDGIRVLVDTELEPYVAPGRPCQGTFVFNFPNRTVSGGTYPLASKEVVPTLARLSTKVEDIINQFATLYP